MGTRRSGYTCVKGNIPPKWYFRGYVMGLWGCRSEFLNLAGRNVGGASRSFQLTSELVTIVKSADFNIAANDSNDISTSITEVTAY